MKILVLSMNLKKRVAFPIFEQMHNALKNYPDESVQVDFIYRETNKMLGSFIRSTVNGHLDLSKKLDIKKANSYDVIFAERFPAFITEDWNKINTLKAIMIEDQHNTTVQKFTKMAMDKFGFDVFFVRYKTPTKKFNKELYQKKVIWLPFSINTNIYHDYKLEKDIDISCFGTIHNGIYPIRSKLHKELLDKSFYKRIGRPSEAKAMKGKVWPTGEEYARLLNRSKISATCTSKYKYTLMKLFEICGCGSVLMCDYIQDMKDLGFRPNENFIQIKEGTNFKKFSKDILSTPNEIKRISDAGYDLIMKRHTEEIRAKEFIEHLRRVLKK